MSFSTTSKTKNKPLGLCPNPLSLARPQGRWQTYPPTPTVSVGSIQGVKGKMHDFVALDPLSISVGVAKLTEADGAETCQGLRSNRVAWPLQVGGDNALW